MQTSQQLRKHKRRLKGVLTESEKRFAAHLDQQGIRYKTQMIFGFYILDFCLPDYLIDIEIDGSFHDKRQGYDRRRDGFVRSAGLTVIRIPNSDVDIFYHRGLKDYPLKTEKEFRSILAKANSLKSLAMRKRA